MAIEAVLFDVDGTLVDSNDFHVLAWQAAFSAIGKTVDQATIHAQIGKGADMLVPALIPEADEADQERLAKAHGDIFKDRYLARVRPFEGARDLLVRVHTAGQRVVLASSASKAELDHYIDLLDVGDIIAATTTADDVESTKPAPDIFAAALQKVAPLSAEQVMVVGDTPYDVAAAAKCGIATVALRSGKFADDVLNDAGATALYDDVAMLLADYENSPLAR